VSLRAKRGNLFPNALQGMREKDIELMEQASSEATLQRVAGSRKIFMTLTTRSGWLFAM